MISRFSNEILIITNGTLEDLKMLSKIPHKMVVFKGDNYEKGFKYNLTQYSPAVLVAITTIEQYEFIEFDPDAWCLFAYQLCTMEFNFNTLTVLPPEGYTMEYNDEFKLHGKNFWRYNFIKQTKPMEELVNYNF